MTKRKKTEYRCQGIEVNGEMRPLNQLSPELTNKIAGAFIHILGKIKQSNSVYSREQKK